MLFLFCLVGLSLDWLNAESLVMVHAYLNMCAFTCNIERLIDKLLVKMFISHRAGPGQAIAQNKQGAELKISLALLLSACSCQAHAHS